MGKTVHMWREEGGGDMWEISVPSSQFCYEPKMALKNYLLKTLRNVYQ